MIHGGNMKIKSTLTYTMVCTSIYVKLVLRYKFFILDAYHLDTLYFRQQGCDDPLLPFGAKMRRRAKEFEKHRSIYYFNAPT